MKFEYVYLGYLIVLTALTFIIYAVDKTLAKKGKNRISEKTLLFLSAFGGCVGGVLAMIIIRHKTKHLYFWAINVVALLLHGFALYWMFKPLILT